MTENEGYNEQLDTLNTLVTDSWNRVVGVMRKVSGEEFADETSLQMPFKVVGAAGGMMVVFDFAGALYALEPAAGAVLEVRPDGAARAFGPEGEEIIDFKAPIGPAEWN